MRYDTFDFVPQRVVYNSPTYFVLFNSMNES